MRRPQWGPQTAGWAPPYDPGPVSVHGAQVTHGGFDSVSLSVTFRFCCFVCLLVYFCDHSCASPFVLPRALYRSSPGVDAQLIRAAPLQSAAPLTPSYDFFFFFLACFSLAVACFQPPHGSSMSQFGGRGGGERGAHVGKKMDCALSSVTSRGLTASSSWWCSDAAGARSGSAGGARCRVAFLRSDPASNQTASHAAGKRLNASDKMRSGGCGSTQDSDQHWRPAWTFL